MRKPVQDIIINNIPVRTDPALSKDESARLVNDVIQSCVWEGMLPGRIELNRQGEQLQICIYKQPLTRIVTLHNSKERKYATH